MSAQRKTESDRFKGPVKYVEYLFARALVSCLQRMPIKFAYRAGYLLGGIAYKTLNRRRAIVRKNLEIVNAWLAQDHSRIQDLDAFEMSIEDQVREVFRRAGANLFSGFCFSRMSVDQVERHLELKNIDVLKEALSEGKGAIVLLAHMGPWEALAQLSSLAKRNGIDAQFGTMYRPLNNTYLENWFLAQRESNGTRFFSRRSGFHKPVDFIRSGGMLGILSDQKMREGVTVAFFGVPVKTTPIPGLFLRRSGAPAISIAIRTIGFCHWEIRFLECPELKDESLKFREEFGLACNRSIERVLSYSPLDGFWLHKRFSVKRSQ